MKFMAVILFVSETLKMNGLTFTTFEHLKEYVSEGLAVFKSIREVVNPDELQILHDKTIDLWIIIQAAISDTVIEFTTDGIHYHLNSILHSLTSRDVLLKGQGYIGSRDNRYTLSHSEIALITDIHRRYVEYFTTVINNNSSLLSKFRKNEYRLFIVQGIILLDF